MRKFLILYLLVSTLSAQWSNNPAEPVQIGTGIMPQIAPTPDGGLYIAWLTDGNYHVYLQRLDSDGNPQWTPGGILVSNQPNSSWIAVFHLNLIADSEGNAIISTVDTRTGVWEVYAYKINSSGTHEWGTNGVQLSSTGLTNTSPQLVNKPDDNSAIITWTDNYSTIRLQRISAEGNILWTVGGIEVSDISANLMSPQPKIDDNGQILVQWIRQTGSFPATNSQVQVSQFGLDGTATWPAVAMGPSVGFPMGNWSQDIITDVQGGSFSSWTELAGNNQTGFVRHIDGDGNLTWTNPVEASLESTHFRVSPQLAVAGDSHSAYVVWNESDASQANRGIYGQLINPTGGRQWGDTGIAIESLSTNVYFDVQTSSTGEDLVVAYIQQSSIEDIYASRINESGNFVWTGNRVQLTINGTEKTDLNMTHGNECNFFSWSENGSIRAHCLRNDGSLGPPPVHVPGIISVPSDYATIQAAIDAAINGDTVLVSPGIYTENLNISGKEILLTSYTLLNNNPAYMYSTIIDANQNGSALVLIGEDSSPTKVMGFTLQNGIGTIADPDGDGNSSDYGGGIYCENSSPHFSHLRIKDNSIINGGGGGFFGYASNAIFENVLFENNSSEDVGGGIYARANSDMIIKDCKFINNACADVGGAMYARDNSDISMIRTEIIGNTTEHAGAGIGFKNDCHPTLVSVTITDNEAAHFGGSIYSNSSFPTVVNSILWNNQGGEVYFANFDDSSEIVLAYTDIMAGEAGITTNDNGSIVWLDGNLDQDPFFADTLNEDYSLLLNSPCRDAGAAFFVYENDTMVNMQPDDYLDDAPDMGAVESMTETVYYFPLINQQQWTYASDHDTFAITITDSVMTGDVHYFEIDHWYQDSDPAYFSSIENQIMVLTDTSEFLFYDFGASFSESWEIPPLLWSSGTMTLVSLGDTVDTPLGSYWPCYKFYHYIGEDAEFYDWFAPDVGLVQRDQITIAGLTRYQLINIGPVVSVVDGDKTFTNGYHLSENYPNPFNPTTTLHYELPSDSDVKIVVYDVIGREVSILVNTALFAGSHQVIWNGKNSFGKDMPTGTYYAKMSTTEFSKTIKMILIK
ncbi:MAG: T9SS type A sorting domain-containing protein [Candidatus Marinimicrobia bacterium]|nr:T9SS type A sorting domain-containing protein [Candidatus Neomarinimicrobiota bacterium]